MPNHVTNIIEIQNDNISENVIKKMLEQIMNDEQGIGSIDFNKIIPMPDYIFRGNLGTEERAKFGENNWYDWSISHWGTKWNAYSFGEYEDSNSISFQTAWTAPHPVLQALSNKFPNITLIHQWADEDIGANVGKIEYKSGESINEYYPETQSKEAYEMAADIMGVELEDYGLILNDDGTEYEWSDDQDEDIDEKDGLQRGDISL